MTVRATRRLAPATPYKVVLPYGEKVTFYLRKDAERFVEWTNKK